MRKVIATSLSFAMLLGLTSCGNTNNNIPNRVEKPTKETSVSEKSIEEKNVIDPFENVSYTIPESEDWNENIYPEDFKITFDASKSPIGEVATFTFFIESADNEKIVIRSRANIDTEEVQEYLEENNLKVDENEKTFEINVDDLETNLLLSDYIDKTTKEKMKSDMLKYLETELEAEDENAKLDFTLEKLYFVIPKEIEYNLKTQKVESSVNNYSDNSSFEDKEIIANEATLYIDSSNAKNIRGLAVYSDNNGAYYCVDITTIHFNKNIMNAFFFQLLYNTSTPSLQPTYEFKNEDEVYDKFIEWEYSNDDSAYNKIEVTLE